MGLTVAMLTLKNPCRPDLPPLEVQALADTGTNFLCIPTSTQVQLGLEQLETRNEKIADR